MSASWPITDAQLSYIRSLLHATHLSPGQIETLCPDYWQRSLTKDEASELIDALIGIRDGTRSRPIPKGQLSLF